LNVLAIDTSTRAELVAVSRPGMVADRTAPMSASHASGLFDRIDGALKDTGISVGDLNLIGVGTGPGSFTGIRIGVTTTRMLAQVLRVPLVGLPTPLLYACSTRSAPGTCVIVAFDAKKSRVFGALYRMTDDPLAPEVIVPPGDYGMEYLCDRACAGVATISVGDGAGIYAKALSVLEHHTFMEDFLPSGETACMLTERFYHARPEEYADLTLVMPCYARKSDAEIALEKKRNGE
jgi:tRNA threonylcarbamoyladenosine biosynthesis protein TsaB